MGDASVLTLFGQRSALAAEASPAACDMRSAFWVPMKQKKAPCRSLKTAEQFLRTPRLRCCAATSHLPII